jgi:hypothetical protein
MVGVGDTVRVRVRVRARGTDTVTVIVRVSRIGALCLLSDVSFMSDW